jgi:hypothetical protein
VPDPSGRYRFLLPASFELRQEPFWIQRFGLPNLLSQPLQLDKLFEQIRRKLLQ